MEKQEDDLERGRREHTTVNGDGGYAVAVQVEEVDVEHRGERIVQIHEHEPPPDPEPLQHNGDAEDDSNKSLRSASAREAPARSDLHRGESAAQRTRHTGRCARQQEPDATYGYQPSGRDLHIDDSSLTAHTRRENEVGERRSDARVAPSSSATRPELPVADPTTNRKLSFLEKWGRQTILLLLVTIVALLSLLVWAVATRPSGVASPIDGVKKEEGGDEAASFVSTLELVKRRGELRCGVSTDLDGFCRENPDTGSLEGFEVDLCRAVAAAVLGDADKVELVSVTSTNRFVTLASGGVDVLVSHNTLTMDRDVYVPAASTGFTFSVPYLYDGLVFAGQPAFVDCAENNDTSTGVCEQLNICVEEDTTYTGIVTKLLPDASIQGHQSLTTMYDRFFETNGGCNVIAGGQFEVAKSVVFEGRNDQEYKVGQHLQSFEPLALMTRDGDPAWSDMVQWVLQALLSAEEQAILKVKASSLTTKPDLGESVTLQFQNAIAAVGNYGEMYERHLERILPRGEVNKINEENSGDGLIFSHPFGSLDTNGPGPVDGGTLEAIRKRGHLRCGIARTPAFGELKVGSKEWTGFDVDFCKAVASAIFFGLPNVDYVALPATERFKALADGRVDMLSRITTWNLERDIMETDSKSGFSFSQVNFYGGISVGGLPPYGECADKRDWLSEDCKDLRVCVNNGTITVHVAREVFSNHGVLVETDTADVAIDKLVAGDCNAIMAGDVEVVEQALRDRDFKGNYTAGSTRFLKDPLALVTRQDDPQFSSFVKWIVSATFYAEEEGIGQENARDMPLVYLFGPLYGPMLVDAIQSVGNYGDIYNRNLQPFLPREEQNKLSVNPYRARHYPLSGF